MCVRWQSGYLSVCVSARAHKGTCTHKHTHALACVHTHTHTHLHIHTHTYTHTHTHTCTHARMHACAHTHTHTHTHTRTHTHAHTHAFGCLTSQQHASVSQGRICSDNYTCCHTEIEVADQTFYLTQSQYTDTRLTSPSADPITPGTWQGSHWSASSIFKSLVWLDLEKIPVLAGFKPGIFRSRGGRLTTRPTRWSQPQTV